MNKPTIDIQSETYVGRRVPRKEDARLLTGHGVFVDDIVVPGMQHVAFLRSPIARGRIRRLDLADARALPGVHAIYTADDLAKFKINMLSFFLTTPEIEIPPLATDRVAYVGDPIALIIAQDRYIAEDAAGLAIVDFDEEDPVVGITAARTGLLVHSDTESNASAEMGEEHDEAIEQQLAGAAHLETIAIRHQRISQSPMETRGIVAHKHSDNEMTVYAGCQSPQMAARYISQAFGFPATGIRVIAKDVGGSFGLKVQLWREEISVIAACMIFGRPLKWIEDRLENLTAANQAREQEMTLRVGFDTDARIVAAHHDYSIDNGAYPHEAECNAAVSIFLWTAYKIPSFNFHATGWYTNTVGLAAYRGPWAIESLIRETMLDRVAHKFGIEPYEIRRRNLVAAADQPRTTPFGLEVDDITPLECLELLLKHFDVAAFRAQQEAARKNGRLLGLGIATYIEPTAGSAGIGVLASDVANLRIEPTGKVTAILSTHSQGHGTQTTMAQVIADHLGVPYQDVSVHEDDSSRGGFGAGASGSRQAVAGGGACIRAAALLVDKVKRAAAHLLEAQLEQIRICEGVIYVDGEPDKTRPLRAIAEIAYGEPDRLPEGMDAGFESQYRYRPPPMTLTSAAHACTVEVDTETGFVKILRWISSEDCGTIIHPAMVEGQIAGGLAQAIGTVLLEEVAFDTRGNPLTATYKDYHLPTIFDVPDIEYLHASTMSKAEGGFRGVGEGGCIIGPPTLVNAIADALEPFGGLPQELRLPLSPTRILEILEHRSLAPELSPARAPPAPAKPSDRAAPAPAPSTASSAPIEATQPESPTAEGAWKLTLATPMGAQSFTGRFKTKGNVITGLLESTIGSQEFEGEIENGHVTFEMKVTKPMSITLKYDFHVSGDRLAGKVKMGMLGNSKLTGERIK